MRRWLLVDASSFSSSPLPSCYRDIYSLPCLFASKGRAGGQGPSPRFKGRMASYPSSPKHVSLTLSPPALPPPSLPPPALLPNRSSSSFDRTQAQDWRQFHRAKYFVVPASDRVQPLKNVPEDLTAGERLYLGQEGIDALNERRRTEAGTV